MSLYSDLDATVERSGKTVAKLVDAAAETAEIRISVPDAPRSVVVRADRAKDGVVRTVSENAKTLKFQTFSFERE